MQFLNLTDSSWDDIYDIVNDIFPTFNPFEWGLQPPHSQCVSINDTEYLASAEAGILQYRKYPRAPTYTGLSSIVWQLIPALLGYRDKIQNIIPTAAFSGTHHIAKDGYMSWHTNQYDSACKPHRLYVTYNDSPGSVFRYILPGTKEVITFEEPVGWYVKIFYIEDELPHCLISRGNRWSVGMRF